MSYGQKLAVAVLALAVSASSAVAQIPLKPWSFGVQAGASMPTGDFGNLASTGFNVGGNVKFKSPGLPVAVQGEVLYNSFSGKTVGTITWPTTKLLGFGGAASWAMPSGLYFIGGLGMYNFSCDGCTGSTKLGLNGGLGFNLPLSGFGTFVEARFHTVMTDNSNTNFMPISFGIRF